jgi:WhiB family redox-sensing transcriptional regulator
MGDVGKEEGPVMKQQQGTLGRAWLAAGESWRPLAACRFMDPEVFFPVSGSGKGTGQAADAKAVCAACGVRRDCLSFALRTRQAHGIWGGMTEQERYPVRKSTEQDKAAATIGLQLRLFLVTRRG